MSGHRGRPIDCSNPYAMSLQDSAPSIGNASSLSPLMPTLTCSLSLLSIASWDVLYVKAKSALIAIPLTMLIVKQDAQAPLVNQMVPPVLYYILTDPSGEGGIASYWMRISLCMDGPSFRSLYLRSLSKRMYSETPMLVSCTSLRNATSKWQPCTL